MRKLIEKNMTVSLLVFSILGLIIPCVDKIPNVTVDIIIAIVIYIACFRIDFADIPRINFFSLIWFYLLRFVAFPLLIYYAATPFSENIAVALGLLALLPPATATPALTHIFKGNLSISFAMVVGASLLAPFTVPGLMGWVMGKTIRIDMFAMGLTLMFTLFLPGLLFYFSRRQQKIINFIERNGSLSVILLIGLAFAIAISKQKTEILHTPKNILFLFLITAVIFLLFYLVGWLVAYKKNKPDRIAYMLSSGAINISLGVSIALLYFPKDIVLYLIVGQFAWIFAMTPLRIYLERSKA